MEGLLKVILGLFFQKVKAMATIKDIKVGDKYFFTNHAEEFKKLYEITSIEVNNNAGEPIRDMFGGVVWSVPKYTIHSVSEDGKKSSVSVQSDNTNFDGWITFIKSK